MKKTMMAGLFGLSLFSLPTWAEEAAVPAAEVPGVPAATVKMPETKETVAQKSQLRMEKLQKKLAELTELADTNKDGTLDADEIARLEKVLADPANKAEALAKQIKQCDTDGNWKLDDKEVAAALAESAKAPAKAGKKTTVKEKTKTADYNIPDPNFMKPQKAAKPEGKVKKTK